MTHLCHAACLLTVNSDRLRSMVWKVAKAASSTLRVVVLKREHSVPSLVVSPLTRARCYSLTPPCVKANSEALFKKQLLRRCTISWNDLLTFLPLLISKQWIIRRTRADRTACFFQSKKSAPYILTCPRRDSLVSWAFCKARRAGCASPSSHHLIAPKAGWDRAEDRVSQPWPGSNPLFTSAAARATQFIQEPSQGSCLPAWHVLVYSIIFGTGWVYSREEMAEWLQVAE